MQEEDAEFDSGEDDFHEEDFSGAPGQDRRFLGVSNLILRPGNGLTKPGFEPCEELLAFMQSCSILVVGAGGLGCELLKNLALTGFQEISVIDMDTIDLSNLNRQFLFRQTDIGQSKAICAAKFISTRIPSCKVTPIEDLDADFYRQFKIIVCGLDSVVARRWMNGMVLSIISYDEDGNLDPSTVIPIIDGGTEGFKGNVRVVAPGISACLECSIDLYPPAINFPMCTIANTPRLPEHCIEYAKVVLWPEQKPFGKVSPDNDEPIAVDGDDPQHINWIFTKAEERAKEYGIPGVTYRLTLGVVKHIIPAVASTNAIIAAACASEVFKTATFMYGTLDNYMMFNNSDGIYGSSFQMERNENCLACSQKPQFVKAYADATFQTFIDSLKESSVYQMRSPGITATIAGKQRTLYMPNVPFLEEQTRGNLAMTLRDLGFQDGQELTVVDSTSPTPRTFVVQLQ